jgi:hypothetical protein
MSEVPIGNRTYDLPARSAEFWDVGYEITSPDRAYVKYSNIPPALFHLASCVTSIARAHESLKHKCRKNQLSYVLYAGLMSLHYDLPHELWTTKQVPRDTRQHRTSHGFTSVWFGISDTHFFFCFCNNCPVILIC